MGRPKLSLPFGGKTVVECVVAPYVKAGSMRCWWSSGRPIRDWPPWLKKRAHRFCACPMSPPMRATVERDSIGWRSASIPDPDDAWLLARPTIRLSTGGGTASASGLRRPPPQSIMVPVHEGRRGHPTLIAWRHVSGIRAHPSGKVSTTICGCNKTNHGGSGAERGGAMGSGHAR